MNRELLKFEHVSFAYPGRGTLFADLGLAFRKGEFAAVIGPNGSGKSTLLKLACGMLRPAAGQIVLDGRPLADLPAKERARKLAVTFQLADRTIPYRVRDLVMLGRIAHRKFYEPFGDRDAQAADRALASMEMADCAERPYAELSGGEQQRVLLAAALAQEPEMLLLDEPTSALDFGNRFRLMKLLRQLAAERGLCVVMISHDLELTARFARRLVLLHEGKIVADGGPADVVTPENIRLCYRCPAEVVIGPSGEPLITVPAEDGL